MDAILIVWIVLSNPSGTERRERETILEEEAGNTSGMETRQNEIASGTLRSPHLSRKRKSLPGRKASVSACAKKDARARNVDFIFPGICSGQDLAPWHPLCSGPVATTSSGLIPRSFLMSICNDTGFAEEEQVVLRLDTGRGNSHLTGKYLPVILSPPDQTSHLCVSTATPRPEPFCNISRKAAWNDLE